MLVSATEMLKKAKAGHYAVGQFNINNLEWTKSILLTAEELKSPVILGVSGAILRKALFKKVLHNFTKFSTQKKPVKKLFLPASFACLFVQEILFSVLPNQRNFITVIRIPKNFLLLYKENPSYKEQNA